MIELSCVNALKVLNMVHGSIQSPDRLLAIRTIWPSQSLNGALEFFNFLSTYILFEDQSRGLSVLVLSRFKTIINDNMFLMGI